jgi:hypothetical protein
MPRKVSFGPALHGVGTGLSRGTLKLNSAPPTTPIRFRAMSAERSGTVDSLADPIRLIVVSLMIWISLWGSDTIYIKKGERRHIYFDWGVLCQRCNEKRGNEGILGRQI